ncbi:MAG: glycosyltransferase family 4 protein [Verrucomicrobia bacterium]|nr:glycosyltransferase family 4 protein [Verrucomicrobiota bacterium]
MSLLFYDDSPVFGGHEVMALLGLEAVLAEFPEPVSFLAAAANEKLCAKVAASAAAHPHLRLETLSYHSSKFEALRNQLQASRIRTLATRFRQLRPSLVVAIQGNIEHSSLALQAARSAAIPVTSYLPVPHSNAAMGARLGALRDVFASRLFRLPDSFITITDEMARLLRLRGATAPIHIVYNGVDTSRFRPGDAAAACRQLELPPDKILLGMIGRIEFRQKQQQLLIQALTTVPALGESCHLVFAGEGPDVAPLQALIRQHHLSASVLPWCDPACLYQALDALVIPSRYEGLPLVMLEALASGTAVLASDRDGMRDVLPPEWRFCPDDPAALAAALAGFIAQGRPKPGADLIARVRNTMSLASFRQTFSATLRSLAGRA